MSPVVLRCLSAALLLLAAPQFARAVDMEDPDTAVAEGREALDRWWGYPWYDAQTDDLRRIRVEPTRPVNPTTNTGGSNLLGNNLLRFFGWIALAVVLSIVAWLLIRAYMARETRDARLLTGQQRANNVSEVDRVTALPFQVEQPEADLLAAARRHYTQGNYSQAVIYLYSHQLVELDKAQCIRLARGKTNRQYVREARRNSPVGDLLHQTMTLFEEAFFGHHAIDKQQFESCWNQLPDFQRQLTLVPA